MANSNVIALDTAGPGGDTDLQESYRVCAFWKSMVDAYAHQMRKYHKRGNMVVKRYRDERNRVEEGGGRRMNYLWANTQVMYPAIYSTCPIPIVDRKFLDRDPTGRLSSQMLERSLKNELDQNGFHNAIGAAVLDKLLSGRGTVWCRYVPEVGEGDSIPGYTTNAVEDELFRAKHNESVNFNADDTETEKEEKLESTQEQVIAEKTEVDYIDWRDFGYAPVKARNWNEVQAIWKRLYISRQEAREYFGKKIASKLRPDTTQGGTGSNPELDYSETSAFQDVNERNIVVYEIWNKSDRTVYWISTGYDYLCRKEEDPLGLTGFFPVPPPLFSTSTNDTLVPVPDYIEWQDQAIQIDELTQRLAMLAKACKVVGVYSAKETALKRIFDEGMENELVPVDQWALLAEAGGIKGVIDFVPIDQIQKTIETLQKVRQQVQIDLDQVTGLSDVIRGTSDSRETLGGLRLKNNNAGTRLSKSQAEVARFARDTIRILAEIISKHFSDDAIIESSGILFEDALQPDTVLREWEADNGMGPEQQPKGPPQAPQAGPQGANQVPQVPMLPPPGGAPQGPPMPGMLANPMAGSPQATPQQNNIIPFPGGAPGQPNLNIPQQPSMGELIPQGPVTPDPEILIAEKLNKAIELLRKDVTRGYRIEIETDSTIFGDKYQERQDSTEFIASLGAFMKQFGESAQAEPALMPLMGKALQWGVRKWRVGRDLESEVDSFVAEMTKKAKLLKDNPKPSPDEQKAQADIQLKMHEAKIQEANDQRDHARMERDDQRQFQMDQAKDQRELQKMQMEMQLERERMEMEREKMQMEMQMMRQKHQMETQKMQLDAQVKTHEANVNQQVAQTELHHETQSHQNDMQMERERMDMEREKNSMQLEQQETAHKQKLEQGDAQHKQKLKQAKEAKPKGSDKPKKK